MEVAVSVELNDEGGRLLFRNRQTRSLLFSYDIEHKAEAARIVSQLSVLMHHFETLDMFRPAAQRPDPGDALWQSEWRTEKQEVRHE